MQTSAVTHVVRVHVGRAAAALLHCPCGRVGWKADANILLHVCGTTLSVDYSAVVSLEQRNTQCC